MNKKILLGSIIAVVILILVSFTGVVGYQTTKSSTIAKASPLFNIRTQRAINRESKDLTCDYVGKGKQTLITIPKRDNRTILIQKIIDLMKRMVDNTINRLIDLVINRLQQDNTITSKNIRGIVAPPEYLRGKPIQLANHRIFKNIEFKDRYATEYCNTMGSCLTSTPDLGCFLFRLVLSLFTFFLAISVTIHMQITYYVTILFRCSQ